MGIKVIRAPKGSFFEYLFYCEGCECDHGFRTKSWPMPKGLSRDEQKLFQSNWTFNGDMSKPTLSPSLHVHIQPTGKKRYTQCHSFIKNGNMNYLTDCRHELKGIEIEIPDYDDWINIGRVKTEAHCEACQ